MKKITVIQDINDPRIAPYRSLKTKHPEQDGTFIAESAPVVQALLNTSLEITSCLTTEKFYKTFLERSPSARKKNIDTYLMKKEDIEDIIGFRFHHGIMMAVRSPEKNSIKDLLENRHGDHLLVALNGIHDPQNLGLIIRNAAAFGANALIVDGGTYEPYYRKTVRISMGAIFNIPIAYEPDLTGAFKHLKKEFNTKIIVTSPGEDNTDLAHIDLSGNICIVLGNELSGVSPDVLEAADQAVKIPILSDRADSLNVACTSSIFLYQAKLQRQLTC